MRSRFDSVVDAYTETRRPLPAAAGTYVAERLRALRDDAPGRPVRFLDLATGNGALIRTLPSVDGTVLAGADLSCEMLKEARRLMSNNPLVFVNADVHRLPFRDASLDMVACCQAIHLFEIDRFLGEVKRVLTDRGMLIVITYDLIASAGSPADHTNVIFRSMVADDLWPGFSRTGIHPELMEWLEEHGLIPCETLSMDSVSTFSADEWQRRIESSSLALKIWPAPVREAILREHAARLGDLFGGRTLAQRQRCWIVSARKEPALAESAPAPVAENA